MFVKYLSYAVGSGDDDSCCVCVGEQNTEAYQRLQEGCSGYEDLSNSLRRKRKEAENTCLFWKTFSGRTTVRVSTSRPHGATHTSLSWPHYHGSLHNILVVEAT